MSEYEMLFWALIAVMFLVTFCVWIADWLFETDETTKAKRIAKTNREAAKLVKQAHRKIDQRETKWGDL